MNATIKAQLNRKSIRSFTGEAIKAEDLALIIQAGQQAPTSIGAQQISLVVIDQKDKIQQIAEIAGGQPQIASADKFIVVVIDFNRTHVAHQVMGKEQAIHRTLEGLIVGAVDAGIMLSALEVAANALGYGCTAIGGIRNNPQAMIDLLKLPPYTFPVVGLTLGVIDPVEEPKIKPRVVTESFAFYNTYQSKKVADGVTHYVDTLRLWWDTQGLSHMGGYAETVANYYSQPYYPEVKKTLEKQGFSFE